MVFIFDFLLILYSSILALLAYKKVVFQKNCSIANYVLLIIYVFCVIPIIFNYLVGIPSYSTIYWYKVFIEPMKNEAVNIIYDIYILFTLICLYFFCCRKRSTKIINTENFFTNVLKNRLISILLILSPIIYIIFSGNFYNFLTFNVASVRGVFEGTQYVTPLLLISIITFFSIVFKNNLSFKKIFFSLIYFFVIVWISGKRFMIANILLLSLYYVSNMNLSEKIRKKIFKMIPFFVIFLIFFSGFYLVKVRPLSNTSARSVYEMLRVDFGRDDVIKYVIDKEFIKNTPILEYRGQSFVGLLGSFIPRKIWNSKPYPHYMYLTSSILGLSIFDIPAGTTPSWLEMCLCNFYIMGFLIAPLSLIFFCKLADNSNDVDSKALYLLLIVVLLTQSMDVYLVAVVMLFLMRFLIHTFKNKKIKLVWK